MKKKTTNTSLIPEVKFLLIFYSILSSAVLFLEVIVFNNKTTLHTFFEIFFLYGLLFLYLSSFFIFGVLVLDFVIKFAKHRFQRQSLEPLIGILIHLAVIAFFGSGVVLLSTTA